MPIPSLAPVINAHVPFEPNCVSYVELANSLPDSTQHKHALARHRLLKYILTDVPGKMNKLAIMRQNEKILIDSHSRPMNAKTCVVGDAQ